jgi:hypothetical protein
MVRSEKGVRNRFRRERKVSGFGSAPETVPDTFFALVFLTVLSVSKAVTIGPNVPAVTV